MILITPLQFKISQPCITSTVTDIATYAATCQISCIFEVRYYNYWKLDIIEVRYHIGSAIYMSEVRYHIESWIYISEVEYSCIHC